MTYGDSNVLLTYNGGNVIIDADGNITKLPLCDGTLEMTYDYANRMKTAGAYEYGYDLEGNRVSVKNGAGTTSYVVNPNSGLSQVLVREKPDGAKTYYIYGLGLIGEQSESGYRAYHFDCRGSTVAITAESGAVSDTVTYTPFGEVAEREGSTDTPFLYCGAYGVQTDGNGLLYMRARYYSPEIGRFVSQDTVIGSITGAGSLNRYAYCGGNPVGYIDPTGQTTYAIGLSGDLALILNLGVSGQIVVDDYGNIGLIGTIYGGAKTDISAFAGISTTVTSADTIYDLAGFGANVGASYSAGEGLVAGAGADVIFGTEIVTQESGNFGVGASLVPISAEMHGQLSGSWLIDLNGVPEYIKKKIYTYISSNYEK